MKLEVETPIDAPPAVVFATMTDVPHWPAFIRGMESVELVNGTSIAPGTRFRETRTMFGRKAVEEMTVATLKPPHRFVVTAENNGMRYVVTHDVTPASGGSHLKLTFESMPQTFAARLMSVVALLMAGSLRKQLASDLADLRAEAERRARS
jgi:uncharacterized protein YndB with AHSA1/START domain